MSKLTYFQPLGVESKYVSFDIFVVPLPLHLSAPKVNSKFKSYL